MGWAENIRDTLRGERGALLVVVGLACVLTSFAGMRLNTLDGIYPVELTLVLRHLLGGLGALLMVVVYRRRPGEFALSKSSRRVTLIAFGFSLSLILRYSTHLFITTNEPFIVAGKLLEDLFGVLLILAWAERMIPRGLRFTVTCFGAAVALMASFQILFTFFQRVPCMVMLSLMPLMAAVLFYVYERSSTSPDVQSEAPSLARGGTWPINMSRWPEVLLYLGTLFSLIFIAGQILEPSLNIQQQSMASQLSIALGNGIAGIAVLVLVAHLDSVRAQFRLALALMFLGIFALATIAFSLMNYLDSTLVTVYLVLTSIGSQLTMLMVWVAPFARLGTGLTPYMMVAVAYGCTLLSRTCSTAVMCATRAYIETLAGFVVSLALVAAFILCFACVLRLPEETGVGAAAPAAPEDAPAPKVVTPFKDVITALSTEHALTQQESRVLALCAKGKNARNIAEEMGVSMNTIKSHMRIVYAKLDIHSQQELIKLVDDAFAQHARDRAARED